MRRTFLRATALLALATAVPVSMAQAPAGPPPAGGPAGARPAGAPAPRPPPMYIESKAFEDGGVIPLKFSLYGSNTMPDFKISNVPANAQSIAVILHDLDVASGGNPEDNLHWLAWNIPATTPVTQLEEGKLPDSAVNGRGRGYTGMGAGNRPGYNHYVFEFFALSSKLDLPATPGGRAELLEAMKGKVVGKAAYVGRFRNDTNAPMAPRGGAGGGAGAAPAGAPPRPAGQ
jgi:phosphatidylethanolamine-binding protein (PEBP) family uncharacterized protein